MQTDGQEASRGYKVRKIALLCFLGIGGLWVASAIAAAVVISLDSPSGSSDSAGGKASKADAGPGDESQRAATDAPDRKHVKVVAYASQKADYIAFDHENKYLDSYRIKGREVYEYDLPEGDGMSIMLSATKGHDGGDVSLQVYEDGVLIKGKSGDYFGNASVWYDWKWSRA